MKWAMLLVLVGGATATAEEWQRLAPLPDREGFAGAFVGVANDALLVAGGANFPGKKPWEGGTKVWYDTVYRLAAPDAKWQTVGKLPRPLGYGVSVTYRDAMICVGGSDAQQHYADAFQLAWRDGKLKTTDLPALPQPLANMSGALIGNALYVAGGIDRPAAKEALATLYRIDLSSEKPRWEKLPNCPGGGRMLAVAASFEDAFWLVGGCALEVDAAGKVTRKYLRDAYRFRPRDGWQRIADLPYPVVAASSPAPVNGREFCILGGDDGSQVAVEPTQHRGFRRSILRYNPGADAWRQHGKTPVGSVTLGCVKWRDGWVLPSGEIRPGVRTPEVWLWQPASLE